MRIGLPKDKRRFKKATCAQKEDPDLVTKDIEPDVTEWTKCNCCGLPITGHMWRVAPGKYECFRCSNE